MNRQMYEDRMKNSCRTEWFKNHVATAHEFRTNVQELKAIDWGNPNGGSTYWMRYIISGATLIVIGDTGDAVFQWSERVTWEFLAGCDLHYFHSKCQASEMGRKFMHWDNRVFSTHADDWMIQNQFSESTREKVLQAAAATSRDELMVWLAGDYHPKGCVLDDPMYKADLLSLGDVIHPRCIGMWVGLKMIHEQISK